MCVFHGHRFHAYCPIRVCFMAIDSMLTVPFLVCFMAMDALLHWHSLCVWDGQAAACKPKWWLRVSGWVLVAYVCVAYVCIR
jgi:hypothetical protein